MKFVSSDDKKYGALFRRKNLRDRMGNIRRWLGRYGGVAILILTSWSFQGLAYVSLADHAKPIRSVEEREETRRILRKELRQSGAVSSVIVGSRLANADQPSGARKEFTEFLASRR